MTSIIITYQDGTHCYSYMLTPQDIFDIKDMMHDWKTNGSNPWMHDVTFEHEWRPVEFMYKDISQFNVRDGNKTHGIFGWNESIWQNWLIPDTFYKFDPNKLKITVRWV